MIPEVLFNSNFNSMLTCTKQPLVLKCHFTLSIDWLLKTGFIVLYLVFDMDTEPLLLTVLFSMIIYLEANIYFHSLAGYQIQDATT